MKLAPPTNTLQLFGVTQEAEFTIKANRKMFDILAGLYSNIPLAIVRELGTNCLDSHKMAGTPEVPFHIHLPNTIEPWLTIQDFGTGIKHEDIYSIYTTFGASTKEDTNDQVGCLGLGSKSPNAYADNYLVTSIFQGEKRIYSMHYNENGKPSVALMSSDFAEDQERDGLAVQIAIKPEDFYRFQQATEQAFRFFEVKPTISGGVVNWKNDVCVFSGTGWKSYVGTMRDSMAVMGGVAYPIDSYSMDSKYAEFLRRGGLVIEFAIGDLEFTPSRESLKYTDKTIEALNIMLEFITTDFVAKVGTEVGGKADILEAMKTVLIIKNKFYFLKSHFTDSSFMYKGEDITNPHNYIRSLLITNKITSNVKKISYGRGRRNGMKLNASSDFTFNGEWYTNNLVRGGESRVKHFVKDRAIGGNSTSIMIVPDDIKNVLITAGIPDSAFNLTSTLPALTALTRVKSGKAAGRQVLNGVRVYSIGFTGDEIWDRSVLDSNNLPSVYIVKDCRGWGFSVKNPALRYSVTDKGILISLLEFGGLASSDIVMVSAAQEKHMIKAGIPNMNDWLVDVLDPDLLPEFDDLATVDKYTKCGSLKALAKDNEFVKLPANNFLRDYVETIITVHDRMDSVKGFLNYLKRDNTAKAIQFVHTPAMKVMVDIISTYDWSNSMIVTLANEIK